MEVVDEQTRSFSFLKLVKNNATAAESTVLTPIGRHDRNIKDAPKLTTPPRTNMSNDITRTNLSNDITRMNLSNDITRTNLSSDITVVTAYWNLGSFKKGTSKLDFGTPLYHKWAKVLQYLTNPLVVYTDSQDFANLISTLRNSTTLRTKMFVISRNSSWAFSNVDKIRKIFSSKGYPKHHPNTVVPEYPCAQHAKYDVIVRAAEANFYQTNFFAWLDVGYFRFRKSTKRFKLIKPKGFNESMVAMNEVFRKENATIAKILKRNLVWVGGGLFIARCDVIIAQAAQFKRAVDYFLSKNVINTDQQVLMAMYSNEGVQQLQPTTKLQTYWSNRDWFYLGKTMVKESQ